MNDTLALVIAGFNFMSRPFTNGNGEAQPQKLASPPVPCAMCGEPLMLMEFSKGWELVCNNWHCQLYRQPQECRTKNPDSLGVGQWHNNPSTYETYKLQKRENYRLLREAGIKPKEANRISASNGQTQLTLDEAMNE